jgi:hypothetical protein
MLSFFEEAREGGEAFVDEDDFARVPVHEGGHGLIGIVVVYEETGDDEVDFGEVDFFKAANERGGGVNTVFLELLLAKGEGGGGEVIDPDMVGVATEDEGFGPENEDTLAEEDVGMMREPFREDAGGVPALIVVDVDPLLHLGDDFLFHPWVVEFHEGEGFATNEAGFKKGWSHDLVGEY